MQLTKLYTRLMRLMSEEAIDIEAILTALENVEEKKLDAIQILEDLIVIYDRENDKKKKNVEGSNDEIDNPLGNRRLQFLINTWRRNNRNCCRWTTICRQKIQKQHRRHSLHNRSNHQVLLPTGNSNELNCRPFLVTRQSSNTFGLRSKVSWTILTSQRSTR